MSPLTAAAVAGAALGLALWALAAARWARPSLAERLSDPRPPVRLGLRPSEGGLLTRMGKVGIPLLSAAGLPGPRAIKNLRLCDRDPGGYLAEKASGVLMGALFPPVAGMLLASFGALPGAVVSIAAWALFAAVMWFAPDLSLNDEAGKRREEMRRTLSGFADLVVVSLAGGAGVNGALTDASAHGGGWAMATIRETLRESSLLRVPIWRALHDLGERYDTPEFTELAASLQLAGADGARVRTSLAAKARTLRVQFLAEMEAEAQSATERMSLPVVLLFAGFLLLLGYPAMSLILFGT
ncbi:type II secretion system F family protein [Nocardiopsis sp. N85]|uniref:type II secretion system F family protein n=1 Tax=Nocardiopsis sp. N85 TaxID=3029400 RepID=UPI00237EFF02|nr:type II secretion system F family protein [Nocardiopsis sp. N85]MDE3721971.1 type II secretion system F family protein [Nocardiopsis sp. N85]